MITLSEFCERCVTLTGSHSAEVAEATVRRWALTGRVVLVTHPETGAVTIDPIYLSREAARARANTARADGIR